MKNKTLSLLMGTTFLMVPSLALSYADAGAVISSGEGFTISVGGPSTTTNPVIVKAETEELKGTAANAPDDIIQPKNAVKIGTTTTATGEITTTNSPIVLDENTVGIKTGEVNTVSVYSPSGVVQAATETELLTPVIEDQATRRIPGEWFGTGLIDLTYGGIGGDNGTFDKLRVAGYVEGMTDSGVAVTASIDTKEGPIKSAFSDLGARDVNRVLNRLRTDQNYITYGDDSTSIENAPTSGKLYLDVRKGGNSLTWGDFRVEDNSSLLVRTDRTLYGLRGAYQSQAKTVSGKPVISAQAWAASPDRVLKRDVLRGTGGSVYSLSRQDILPGTEKVIIQTRDEFTGRVVSSRTLTRGVDYRVNPFQGIIILDRPLAGNVGTDTPVSGGSGTVTNLVVTYEHVPAAGDADGNVIGGRAEYAMSDNLTLGVAAVKDETGVANNTLYGADLTWEQDGLKATAEYAKSKGPGFGSTLSYTGGVDSEETLSYGDLNKTGTAIRIKADADLQVIAGRPGSLSVWHEEMTAGFVSPDYDIEHNQRETGIKVSTKIGKSDVALSYSDFRSDDGKKEQETNLSLGHDISSAFRVEGGVERIVRTNPNNARDTGERTDAAVKLVWSPNDVNSYWVFGQKTLNASGGIPDNDRYGLGASARLTDKWRAEAEVSDGDLGRAADVAFIRTDESGEVTLGYHLEADDPSSDTPGAGYMFAGVSKQITENLKFKAENKDYFAGSDIGSVSSVGATWANNGWTVDGMVTNGTIERDEEATIKRKGISVGLGYSGESKHTGSVKLEYRKDSSDDVTKDGRVLAFTGDYSYKVDDRWRMMADAEYIKAEGDSSSFDGGEYMKVNAGLAWRGTNSDRLSALFLVSRIHDLPDLGVEREDGNTDRKKATVVSADVNWKVDQNWTVGGKVGHRWMDVAPAGSDEFVKSTTTLAVLRADYAIDQKWDATFDYRVEKHHESGVKRDGVTVGLWREVNDNARVGVGYHKGGVNADLRDLSDPEDGLFINMTAKF